jgi:hypothetical protein
VSRTQLGGGSVFVRDDDGFVGFLGWVRHPCGVPPAPGHPRSVAVRVGVACEPDVGSSS